MSLLFKSFYPLNSPKYTFTSKTGYNWRCRVCSVCIFFFFFGHTDGKCMTHRTSVWLPERVGLGSALSEARRGPWAWSQWVTNPLTANVITCDWETPLSKSTTRPPLSSSSSNKGRQRVKQHIAFLSAERTGHMWKEGKKSHCEMFTEPTMLPRLL